MRKGTGALLALSGAVLLLAGCGPASASGGGGSKAPFKIGMAVGETGYMSGNDIPFSEGAKLAAVALNKKGGIDGHKVEVTVVNMDSNASTGVTAVNELLTKDGVDAVIVGSVSAATAAESSEITAHKVPMIAASVLPSNDQWIFSTLQPVTLSDNAEMGFVKSKLHDKTIGVIYSETPYGQESAALMKKIAQQYGIHVLVSEGVSTDATDITPELQKVQASGAQAVVDVLTGPIHVVEAKDAASMGLKVPIVMAQDARQTFKEATQAYPNTYWVALAAQVYPHEANTGIRQAVAKFRPYYLKKYGHQPGFANAARGWDSVHILAQAVKQSGALTGTKLRYALEHVSYTGTGSIYDYTPSDHTGQASSPNPMAVAQYKNGSLTVVYTPPQS